MATEITQGTKSVASAGTAEALKANKTTTSSVTIIANSANTNNIYVGDANVNSTNGAPLAADNVMTIDPPDKDGTDEVLDLTTIFIDADTNAEGVRFIFFKRT